MKILIDNGHGVDTPGKCSPDKQHREYAWAREIAIGIVKELQARGYDAQRIVTEEYDVPLTKGKDNRAKRVNDICRKFGAKNCLLVSVHNNACGNDAKWHEPSGWSVFVSLNASGNSKRLAQLLYAEAEKRGLKGNRSVPVTRYWTQNLAICRETACPAVLTENMFQDNKSDVAYLASPVGKRTIIQVHVDGILNYIKERTCPQGKI